MTTPLSTDLKRRILQQLDATTSALDTEKRQDQVARLAATHGIKPATIWGLLGNQKAQTLPKRSLHGIPKRSHFSRQSPPPILIQDDDIAIIRFVHQGRFRTMADICKFMSHRPAKKCVERMGALYHNAYLDRPPSQRDYYRANKSRPAYIYALGNRGAALLAEVDGIDMPRIDWGDKNRDITRPFLHHRLLISSTITAFRQAVKDRPDIRFIEPTEILQRAAAATQQLAMPWKFKAKVPTPAGTLTDMTNVPDAIFGLDFTQKRVKFYYLLEADRATMPVWRSTFSRTSLYAKAMTYYHSHKADFHKRAFNVPNYRVLTLTTSRDRTANAIAMIDKHVVKGGSNIFLFTDAASLQNARDVLALAWTSSKGKHVRLAD